MSDKNKFKDAYFDFKIEYEDSDFINSWNELRSDKLFKRKIRRLKMKETMYEITQLQTQLLVLDMLRAKISAKLMKVYEKSDMEIVKSIIVDKELMSTEYVFSDDDQRKAIKDIIGKEMTFEEIREELLGEINE